MKCVFRFLIDKENKINYQCCDVKYVTSMRQPEYSITHSPQRYPALLVSSFVNDEEWPTFSVRSFMDVIFLSLSLNDAADIFRLFSRGVLYLSHEIMLHLTLATLANASSRGQRRYCKFLSFLVKQNAVINFEKPPSRFN